MLMGNKKLEEMLQEEAKELVKNLMPNIANKARWIKTYAPCPADAEVRTTYAGVKDIENALAVFVQQYLTEEVNGSLPVVTLEYDDEK